MKEAGLVSIFNLAKACFETYDSTRDSWFGDVNDEFMEKANGPISDFPTLFLLKIFYVVVGFADLLTCLDIKTGVSLTLLINLS